MRQEERARFSFVAGDTEFALSLAVVKRALECAISVSLKVDSPSGLCSRFPP